MNADDPPAAKPRPAPVSPLAAVLLLAAALVVAALVSVSVARLLPGDAGEEDFAIRSAEPVPARAAPAADLVGVAPSVSFERAGAVLPPGALGGWEVVAGAWAASDGAARATDLGPDGALALVAAPAASTLAQVTLAVPRPGAGLVVSYASPTSYVALRVGRTGQTVEMVEVDGEVGRPRPLLTADLQFSDQPVVLAVRRGVGGFEAVANGRSMGRRLAADPEGPWRVGLVTGFRPRADEARFDDLIVA